MKDNDAGFVGDIPQSYERGLVPTLFADYAIHTANRVAALKPGRVLETAAGTGVVTRRLRDALPKDAHLTASDLNAPMLEVARSKFRPDERIEFTPADAMALPFGDREFDVVVCQFGVMFYPDKDKAYAETYRVLAPGGRYVFSVWDSFRHNPFAAIVHETLATLFPRDPPQFMRVPFSYPFEPIKESLIDAGFADITAAILKIDKAVPDVDVFAHGAVYGSPSVDQIRARGTVAPDEVVAAIAAGLRRAFGPDPIRMPLQAITFTAARPA
jgi:SAM-dependent methyltransferase